MTFKTKLATPIPITRKRAALRLLRTREALGLSRERFAEQLGVSLRAYASIERGEVRMTALEALIELEDELAARGKKAA